ncbi:chromosomal replication initiator protein DnaA [Corynebacterium kozikiae]|uniref:chromosomal replication initiator protein DnaA n=1 Tax=Corynebacterium kozikiae TaxID=2968469 RepID=UPI004038E2C0
MRTVTDPSLAPQHLNQIWHEVIEQLPQVSAQQRAYLQLATPAALLEGIAVISVPNARTKDLIEHDLGEPIRQALSNVLGKPMSVAVSITTTSTTHTEPSSIPTPTPTPAPAPAFEPQHQLQPEREPDPEPPAPAPAPATENSWEQRWRVDHANDQPVGGYRREMPAHNPNRVMLLNPAYTFDNYVVSDSNKLPFSAAIAVAEKPARSYNPLFIWGDSGLGKTHLMHAIGNYAQQLDPSLRIKYVSSEEFTNDYINSVRDDRQESFKRRYRDLDILMVDDIQFLQGKEGTQEEFFHTFNALQQANKQIVLSSDRPPKQLTTLEDRLRTRFQSGLIADIYPPDLETRIAILSKKAQAEGLQPDREVMELIASRFNTSIRELEGAFIRVSAYASLNKQPINLENAQVALRDMMPEQAAVAVTVESIMEVTAEYFKVTLADLKGTSKKRAIAHARQLAMYLCRELTDFSLPRIGEYFDKDHTTVIYSDRKIRTEIKERRDTYNEIQQITQRIKSANVR